MSSTIIPLVPSSFALRYIYIMLSLYLRYASVIPPLCLRFVNVGRSSSLRRQIEFTTEDERITNEGTTERERMKCYINTNGVTTRACQKSQQYAPKGQKLIAQGRSALPLA